MLFLSAVLLSACRSTPPAPSGVPAASPSSAVTTLPATPTATPFEPSPTPVPAVAEINGESISVVSYQAELARFTAAVDRPITPEDETRVLDELINQVLLAQGAVEEGFSVSAELLDERMAALEAELGNKQALLDWMSGNGYLESDFRIDLQRSIAAAWMRDNIVEAVPLQTEQVHARQILLTNSDEATQVLTQIQNGADFTNLAAQYDPVAKGDLGWFPRGYLIDSTLDEAVFTLQPGGTTSIIQTAAGYHILQLIEIDPQHALDPSARTRLAKTSPPKLAEPKTQPKRPANLQTLRIL